MILALALVLGLLLRRLTLLDTGGLLDRVVLEGTFGLYLGWVAVATCANVTAALVSSGVRPGALVSDLTAVLVVAGLAGLGLLFARRLGGRYAVAGAMAIWLGLAWITVARLTDEPQSLTTGVSAAVVAVVVLLIAISERRQPAGALA